jgi:DNA-binding MarR family transcriptional regulator
MVLAQKSQLAAEIVPPIDGFLASQLIDEFVSLERRFVLRDWEPAQLDGGQFCEVAGRILYHLDSGNLNPAKEFGDSLSYLENDQNSHQLKPRKDYLHLARVLRLVYKFRSDRGAVHISPTYAPNHMDSRLVVECVRWVLAEMLRLFWNSDRERVAVAIRQLLRFDTPCVGIYDDRTIVQRVDLKPEEELLILLHHAGEEGLSRSQIGGSVYMPPSTVTSNLKKLSGAEVRQVIQRPDGRYRLTDLGSKRIREELPDKLLLD